MPRFRSLRFRIAAAYIVGSVMLAGLVAGGTYFLVSQRLTAERVLAVQRTSLSKIRFVKEYIQTRQEQGRTVALEDVLNNAQAPTNDIVVIQGRTSLPSSVQFDKEDIPRDLLRTVNKGSVAWTTVHTPTHSIIFGSQIPSTNVQLYFAFTMQSIDRILGLLRKSLIFVIAAAALAAGAVGYGLAGRTIRPLRLAAEAAHRVADGNLETRLDVAGEDELARLAAAFNQMTEALERRIARERRFIADASHELRTPLTALKTSIDFLAERGDDLPPKLRGAAALAAEEVRSLQRLVEDLLELNRVEAGGVVVATDEVDLVDFAKELARRRAPNASVEIFGPDHLMVWTDKMRLERVVGNLLENAVFHGGDGVQIYVEPANGEARIVVADRGPGIDPEQLSSIFERFWRGDTSRRRDGRAGAGLGLAIARENASVLGADIGVESALGEGTRFEVRLPTGREA